jgi:hypothetical protein
MGAGYKDALIKIQGPDLFELREQFKKLPKRIAAKVIGAGLRRAAEPGYKALKQVASKGPTGNLQRSIRIMVKKYPRDGAAVAVVGFVKAGTGKAKAADGGTVKKGPDRAFHQFWLEFGTKDRVIKTAATKPYMRASQNEKRKLIKALGKRQANKVQTGMLEKVKGQGGYIASSFGRLGPFKFKRGKKAGGRVQTTPGYPKAFFLKSAQQIHLRAMLPQRPVATAFRMSRSAIAANLEKEMTKALENGMKIFEDEARRAAQMKDLDKHL